MIGVALSGMSTSNASSPSGTPRSTSATDRRTCAGALPGARASIVIRAGSRGPISSYVIVNSGVRAPRNEPIGATDMCRQASTVTVVDSGDGERAIVTCFQDGQIYVVDPRGAAQIEDITTVGRGPYSAVASTTRKKLYITNFLEDTVSVVDLTPGAPTRNRVVLRIGSPRVFEQ